jgi:hypothetical protein
MEKDIKSGLDFVNKVMTQKMENYRQLFFFLSKFKEIGEKAESKLPCHINVIDELHANENAHSRILARLLQQKTPESNRFEILESFIQYSKLKLNSFAGITIEKPEITQETERIDLWIRENKNYAVIIENKVRWAVDQTAQIERYIHVTKSYGFTEKQIYVIYLSPTSEKEPERQSWGKYYDSEIRSERYINLSFREDIVLWLKEGVLPNIRIRDVYLRSAIEQYIDHLEGLFDLRTINKQINMELQEFIKKELGLNGTPQENIAKLVAKQAELNKVNNQLQLLKDDAEKEIPAYFKDFISAKYNNYQYLEKVESQWGIDIAGLIIPIENTQLRVFVGLDLEMKELFCQVDTEVESQRTVERKAPDLPAIVHEKIGTILTSKEKDGNVKIWKYFGRYGYCEVFECFQKVLQILTKS